MTVYQINDLALKSDYRGCGKVWAAIVDECVVALRYMDQPRVKVPANTECGFLLIQPLPFAQYREQARAELAALGAVVSGECSCTEFIAA